MAYLMQASIILSWNGGGPPWTELKSKDSLARVLSVFITWGGLRILQGAVFRVLVIEF